MEYVGQVPAPPLDRFIDDIYCLTGVPRHRRMNVPPMPSAHLFVNLGGPGRQDRGRTRKETRGEPVGTVIMHNVVSVDGFIADENDDVGPLHDWYFSGDTPITEGGLVDEVAMDMVPVVFGSGKRYFGSIDGQHLLEDPHVVIQGERVLHLRFKVRR
jgi:hypothetical protein